MRMWEGIQLLIFFWSVVTMVKSLSGETWSSCLDVFDFVYGNTIEVTNLNLVVSLDNDSKRRWTDQKMFDEFRSKEIRR